MRRIVLLVAALCLTGCGIMATPERIKRETLADIMSENMGQSYDSIVLAEGIPSRSHQLDDGSIIAEWERDLGVVTHTNRNWVNGQVMGSKSYGRVCVLRYVFKNKIATSWHYDGYC